MCVTGESIFATAWTVLWLECAYTRVAQYSTTLCLLSDRQRKRFPTQLNKGASAHLCTGIHPSCWCFCALEPNHSPPHKTHHRRVHNRPSSSNSFQSARFGQQTCTALPVLSAQQRVFRVSRVCVRYHSDGRHSIVSVCVCTHLTVQPESITMRRGAA